MNSKKRRWARPVDVPTFVFIVAAGFAFAVSAQTTAFSYQGRLSNGGSPANGNYEMQFKLFDSVKAGAQVGDTVTDLSVAVINGSFAATLDFGAAAFDGGPTRYLEIAVRPAGYPDPFTVLAPRQTINSTPYSIQAKNAATADNATNALQLGGIDASEYVTTSSVGNAFVKNDTTSQTANFNITGNGYVGGNFGVGTTTPLSKLDVAATGDGEELLRLSTERPWRFRQAYSGPNTALRLQPLAGLKNFEITAAGGTNVATFVGDDANPRVGIGTTSPIATLQVDGNVAQTLNSYGFVKAMIHVNTDGGIDKCYNGVTNSSAGNCGFSVLHPFTGYYEINLGFPTANRFYVASGRVEGATVSIQDFFGGLLVLSTRNSNPFSGGFIAIVY